MLPHKDNRATLAIALAILALFLQTGCLHTELNFNQNALAEGKPYHNILVCSLSEDPEVGAEVEAILQHDLARHHVVVETGRHLLNSNRDNPIDIVVSQIKNRHFDGIVVTQRVEVPASSGTLKDVLLAPKERLPQRKDELESFTKLQDFSAIYLMRLRNAGPKQTEAQLKDSVLTKSITGKEIKVHARADLLGMREDQIVWSSGGIIEGNPHRAIRDFIDTFAKTIESGLLQAKFIRD